MAKEELSDFERSLVGDYSTPVIDADTQEEAAAETEQVSEEQPDESEVDEQEEVSEEEISETDTETEEAKEEENSNDDGNESNESEEEFAGDKSKEEKTDSPNEKPSDSEKLDVEKIKNEKLKSLVTEAIKERDEKITVLEKYRDENRTANEAIIKAFEAEPLVAEMMKDIVTGKSLRETIVSHFKPEDFESKEGDDDYEDIQEAIKAREERIAEKKKIVDTITENSKATNTNVSEFIKSEQLTEDEAGRFFTKLDGFLEEAYSGKVSVDFMKTLKLGLDYDKKLTAAVKAAEIKVRNEKIQMERKKYKEKMKTELPDVQTKQKPEKEKVVHSDPFSDAIDRYVSKKAF